MPQLSTGLVIGGAYANKLRRVLFAQLRGELKEGKIDSKQIAFRAGELNRILFEILVNKLKIDKGDVVRVRIEYEVEDRDIKWKYDTLSIEVFRRVPDEEIESLVRETVEQVEAILARPVTEEERVWTEREEAEVERELARERLLPPPIEADEAVIHGRTRTGELLAILKSKDKGNIGILSAEEHEKGSKITIVLVPTEQEAYIGEKVVEEALDQLEKNKKLILEQVNSRIYKKIEKDEAEKIIKSKLEALF